VASWGNDTRAIDRVVCVDLSVRYSLLCSDLRFDTSLMGSVVVALFIQELSLHVRPFLRLRFAHSVIDKTITATMCSRLQAKRSVSPRSTEDPEIFRPLGEFTL
jgi:hypothetical protein